MDVVLLIVAACFALFCGANDGAALVSTNLTSRTPGPLVSTAVLTVGVGVVPIVLGTHVAATLTGRITTFSGPEGQAALLLAVVVAVGVTSVLVWRGLPTSLTLALIGGIVGAGLGAGQPVAWGWAGLVLAAGALAPALGLVGAAVATVAWSRVPQRWAIASQIRVAHRIGDVLQSVAYGANDGQKMLAVATVLGPAAATGAPAGEVTPDAGVLVAVAVLFGVGTFVGVRRVGTGMSRQMLVVTPVNAATAQMSSAGAVLASSAVGAPVSMTQTLAGSLIGGALLDGSRRIRWLQVLRLGLAWVVTLPAAVLLAAAAAALLIR